MLSHHPTPAVVILYLHYVVLFCLWADWISRLVKWLSTFVAAWYSLKLLQTKESEAFVEYEVFSSPTGVPIRRPKRFAGRTIDLTIFAVTRALDVVVGELWSQRKERRIVAGKWTKVWHLNNSEI